MDKRLGEKASHVPEPAAKDPTVDVSVIESLPMGVIVVDRAFRITRFNAWAEKLTGYAREEVLGHPCGEILGGAGCEEACPLRQAIKEAEPRVDEQTRIRTKGGDEVTIRLRATGLYDRNGVSIGGLELFEDIREARTRQEESNRLLSMFIHDMKAPLVGIRGLARRLLGMERLDTKMKTYVDTINQEASNLETLVADFLEMWTWQTGRLELRLQPTSLDRTVRQVVERYRQAADMKELRLEFEPHGGLPAIDADPDRLSWALANLVDNAVKYTERGGRVLVGTGQTGEEVFVRVTDEGKGIEPAEVPQVFEPFQRGTGSGGNKGSGIGLAAVKTVVEAHGGRIDVESRPRAGSTFIVFLPRQVRGERV